MEKESEEFNATKTNEIPKFQFNLGLLDELKQEEVAIE